VVRQLGEQRQGHEAYELEAEERSKLGLLAGTVFTPAAPINKRTLFAGRTEHVRRVIDAINQRGQHVVIFGERGVGKTSMANVLSDFLQVVPTEPAGGKVIAVRSNCDGGDDFSTLWRKIFSQIHVTRTAKQIGFKSEDAKETKRAIDAAPSQVTPDVVRRMLTALGSDAILIVIIDEFDRMPNGKNGTLFADTIKTLSDQSVPATVIVVGVADNVDQLIAEHQSIERAMVQVRLPRMSPLELSEIVGNALSTLSMEIEDNAIETLCGLSQGLPHYTHLLGLHSAREAIDSGIRRISLTHLDTAIAKAIENAQQSIITAYHRATMSARRGNLFPQALLACALAKADDLGYFGAVDVRGPMTKIMGRSYDVPAFARHLTEFCDERHGPVLQRTGFKYRYRFRFCNPLMRPFVVMQGLSRRAIDRAVLKEIGDRE